MTKYIRALFKVVFLPERIVFFYAQWAYLVGLSATAKTAVLSASSKIRGLSATAKTAVLSAYTWLTSHRDL